MNYEPWIETYTSKRVYFLDPTEDTLDIYDIAHSLGMQARYTGHVSTFYSVAEHSVIVSYLVPPEHAFAGLMHDSSEAYLGDVAGPLKQHITGYKEIENNLMEKLANKFGFQFPLDPCIKEQDLIQLGTEAKYLLRSGGKDWIDILPQGKGKVPACLDPYEAKYIFLERYEALTGKSAQFSLTF